MSSRPRNDLGFQSPLACNYRARWGTHVTASPPREKCSPSATDIVDRLASCQCTRATRNTCALPYGVHDGRKRAIRVAAQRAPWPLQTRRMVCRMMAQSKKIDIFFK